MWTAAEGYGLSSVGSSWGQGRIPVPRDVRTQETVSFSFPITAPGTLGATAFAWRMVNGAGLLFGDPSEPISITVTAPGEPAACAGLRDRIAAIGLEIERIEARMVGDPQRDGPRQRAINVLTAERDTATQTATSLGCAL